MKRFKIILAIVAVMVVLGTVIALAAKPAADKVNGAKQMSLSVLGNKAACSAAVSFAGKEIDAELVLKKDGSVVASWHRSGKNAVVFSETAEISGSGKYILTISGSAGGIAFASRSVEKTVTLAAAEKPADPKPEEKKDEPAPKAEPEPKTEPGPDKNEAQKPAETGTKKEDNPSEPAKNTVVDTGGAGDKDPEKSEPPAEKQEPVQETKAEEKPAVEMRPEVNYPVIRVRPPYRVGIAQNSAVVINSKETLDKLFSFPVEITANNASYDSFIKQIKKYDEEWFVSHQILAVGLPSRSGPYFTRRIVGISGFPDNKIEIDQYYTGPYSTDWTTSYYFVELGKLFESDAQVKVIVNDISTVTQDIIVK